MIGGKTERQKAAKIYSGLWNEGGGGEVEKAMDRSAKIANNGKISEDGRREHWNDFANLGECDDFES